MTTQQSQPTQTAHNHSPAGILEEIRIARAELTAAGQKQLANFVKTVESAHSTMQRMNSGLAELTADMDMIDADDPPGGDEKYATLFAQIVKAEEDEAKELENNSVV